MIKEFIVPDALSWNIVVRFLVSYIKPGTVLLLEGPLGAGKTTFLKELAALLGTKKEEISSPTFTLIQSYETKMGELLHIDGYRLSEPDTDIEEYIKEEIAQKETIIAVEWPEKFSIKWPKEAIEIVIKSMNSGRICQIVV